MVLLAPYYDGPVPMNVLVVAVDVP
jgi:hypothetical protein